MYPKPRQYFSFSQTTRHKLVMVWMTKHGMDDKTQVTLKCSPCSAKRWKGEQNVLYRGGKMQSLLLSPIILGMWMLWSIAPKDV